ncbi:acyl-CoA thioesterase [Radicibacter daui]|uniref:acyl-CoA thioesterase n=1 Tax=Radicibacter daui TaxID=3064829 RepID=UPI004046C813
MSSTPVPDRPCPTGEPVIRTIAMPNDTNPAGDIFGGWLMAQMDLAAGNIATHYARGRAATVSVDGMSFLSPVFVGDEVSLYGRILSTGRTSMRIFVEAWRRDREGDDRIRVTEATFTFVAIGPDRRPRPLRPEEVPGAVTAAR